MCDIVVSLLLNAALHWLKLGLLLSTLDTRYTTTEPVKVGDFVFVQAKDDNPARYELPLSFGRVNTIFDEDGNGVDESVDENDMLNISWYQPIAKPPQQKYGPGAWELIKGAADAETLDYRSTIERGAIVIVGIELGNLTAKNFINNGRTLILCRFGRPLLRKLKELPNSITKWEKYGVLGL